MSILSKLYTVDQIKAAGGNCMSIATAEIYYDIYCTYLVNRRRRTKMQAYLMTSEQLYKSEDVVMRAVKFGEGLAK